jgi:hypothetical protein
MERDYTTGVKNDVQFFIGIEVEHTPAFGLKTLFVTDIQPVDTIKTLVDQYECQHIYLGANMSFDPGDFLNNSSVSNAWDNMIKSVLKLGVLTTLDFDVKHVEWVLGGCYAENDNFIPQISVKIPYLEQLRYNATIKIDDKDFKASNPGVWCHSLHDLLDRKMFTPWNKYTKDAPI